LTIQIEPWKDEFSDGCSGPNVEWLTRWFHSIFEPDRQCCVAHDKAYYYGGSRKDRLSADQQFQQCLMEHGMNRADAYLYFRAVRLFGRPSLRLRRRSWAFGPLDEPVFSYTKQPAVPDSESSG